MPRHHLHQCGVRCSKKKIMIQVKNSMTMTKPKQKSEGVSKWKKRESVSKERNLSEKSFMFTSRTRIRKKKNNQINSLRVNPSSKHRSNNCHPPAKTWKVSHFLTKETTNGLRNNLRTRIYLITMEWRPLRVRSQDNSHNSRGSQITFQLSLINTR